MWFSRSSLFLVMLCAVGCTSFRTTSLQRCDNDSVIPEATNKKLKGLPVKLKVPSHVMVTIYEQQIILASGHVEALQQQALAAAGALKSARGNVQAEQDKVLAAKQEVDVAQTLATETYEAWKRETDPMKKRSLKEELAARRAALEDARAAHAEIERVANAALPGLRKAVEAAKLKADATEAAAETGYTLVSFSPAQMNVETELLYTDKVFLVDFRRPAGGILDLKEASMDDEQYFKKVQAEVEERTIKDVSAAIETLKTPLVNLKSANKAVATSANTPDENANTGVNFQRSVMACRRFDISEPDWEARLMEFVNFSLNGGTPGSVKLSGQGQSQ